MVMVRALETHFTTPGRVRRQMQLFSRWDLIPIHLPRASAPRTTIYQGWEQLAALARSQERGPHMNAREESGGADLQCRHCRREVVAEVHLLAGLLRGEIISPCFSEVEISRR